MAFKLRRATVKAFTYKIVEFVGTTVVVFLFTRSVEDGLIIAVVTDFLLPYGWFIAHEYFWERRVTEVSHFQGANPEEEELHEQHLA